MRGFRLAAVAAALAFFCAGAQASPWAQAGDAQLRSDIELLANAGVLANLTSQWPLPWAGILTQLDRANLSDTPDYVREAAARVLAAGQAQTAHGFHAGLSADATNLPNVVRGFDALGREDGQAQVTGEFMGDTTSIGVSLGAQYTHRMHHTQFLPDGSYAAQRIGGALVYGGTITHWWGPGWISALSLSNNARPFPQIGIERLDNTPFRSPWLNWIGPWQAEFFVGLLDGARVDRDTAYTGFRFSFNPLPGLEIALARTTELCGRHHDCDPLAYFDIRNDDKHVNKTNDEGNLDFRYSRHLGGMPFEIYMQLMNEDSNPFWHSYTSHLYGGSIWVPFAGSPLRLTAEYTDTVPTVDIFSYGDLGHGAAYNNYDYVDGMRYRGRSLGASLDSDSRLLSFQGSWRANNGFVYTLTYNHADVSSAQNRQLNVVTAAPVKINMGVAGVAVPFRGFALDIEGRLQDDRPRPDHGKAAAIEVALKTNL